MEVSTGNLEETQAEKAGSSAKDDDRSVSLGGELSLGVPPPSPLTGCYLLIIIGEPYSQEHKELILKRLAKGKYHAQLFFYFLITFI